MRIRHSQLVLAAILAGATIGSILAWHLSAEGLSVTGLYFIAVPGGLAAILALVPGNGTDGRINATHGTMIAILASAIIVREGFICVLMALPLILPVVSLVVWSTRKVQDGSTGALLFPLLLLGMSGEGFAYDLPSNAVASETRVLDATPEAIVAALDGRGELPEIEPLLLRLPFPVPTEFTGNGNALGDTHRVRFDTGSMHLEVTERTDRSIRWTVAGNDTPLAGWMTLNHIDARWVEVEDGLELTIGIDYDRILAPAFYFGPLEQWGVSEMAEVLADMVEANL